MLAHNVRLELAQPDRIGRRRLLVQAAKEQPGFGASGRLELVLCQIYDDADVIASGRAVQPELQSVRVHLHQKVGEALVDVLGAQRLLGERIPLYAAELGGVGRGEGVEMLLDRHLLPEVLRSRARAGDLQRSHRCSSSVLRVPGPFLRNRWHLGEKADPGHHLTRPLPGRR